MGLDYGSRRIGIAISDPTRTLARPLTALKRRPGKRAPLSVILALAHQHGVGTLVVGLPRPEDGAHHEWTAEVRRFAEALKARAQVPVVLQDEGFSTVEAESRLKAIGPPSGKHREKGRIDAAAATIILQDWLDGDTPA